jgi:hypothetical protein
MLSQPGKIGLKFICLQTSVVGILPLATSYWAHQMINCFSALVSKPMALQVSQNISGTHTVMPRTTSKFHCSRKHA